MGLLLLAACDKPPADPEEEPALDDEEPLEADDEDADPSEPIAFWIPCEANMPGLNNGRSVVDGGPRMDCIACSAKLEVGDDWPAPMLLPPEAA